MFRDTDYQVDTTERGGADEYRAATRTPQPTVSPYKDSLNSLYQKYYGRDANDDEIATHTTNLQNKQGSMANIEAELARTRTTSDQPAQTAQQPQQKTWDYQQFKNWNGGWGGGTPEQLRQWVESNPYAQGVTIGGTYGDKLFFPGGGGVDAIIGAANGGTAYGWTEIGGNGGAAPATTPTVAAADGGGGNSGVPFTGAAGTGAPSDPERDALFAQLRARAQQGLSVSKDDPAIREASDRFAAQQERNRRQYLSEAAERASAKGLGSSGALDVERRMASERAGELTGQNESNLVMREIDARRQEIAQALQLMGGMLSEDQRTALSLELANLNAALDRERLSASTGLGYAQLGQQASQFADNQALNWANFNRQGDPEYLAFLAGLR